MPLNAASLSGLLRDPSRTPEQVGGVPAFLPVAQIAELRRQQQSHGENCFKDFFKRWPGLYGALVWLVGPSFFTGMTPGKFLKKFPHGGTVLHAGSGTRVLPGDCLNIDLFPFPGVDALADLEALPFKDGAFAGATCDQVLEHVPHPALVTAELQRVVKSGGLIHVASPFVFPWHPSPLDYTRWTQEGLAALFPDCMLVEKGVMAGPCSALTALLAAFFATLLCFGSRKLQSILQYLFLVLFAPLKFFDLALAHMPGAELCAANFYVVVRKQ
jgi:SAM-dependent methyltransferase